MIQLFNLIKILLRKVRSFNLSGAALEKTEKFDEAIRIMIGLWTYIQINSNITFDKGLN